MVNHKMKQIPIALLLLFVLPILLPACATYDMEIPGVAMEQYAPADLPHLFDRVMQERRQDGVLLAGVETVDITPYDRKVWIAGFGPGRKSRGVRDPISARICYLDDGQEAVVLITMDVVGLLNQDVNRIRGLVTAKHPRRIQVIATHNHQGPDTMGYWGPGLLFPVDRGVDEDWMAKTIQAVALGVNRAIRSAQPVRIAFGSIEMESGWSTNLWFPEGEGPNDREISVMRLEKNGGEPLATVVNWACHAESLLSQNKISADFPGYFYEACKKSGGGTGIFLPGALGGMITTRINRYELRRQYRQTEKRVAWAKKLGQRLADFAFKALEDQPRLDQAPIAISSRDLRIPMENWLFRVVVDNGILCVDDRVVEDKTFVTETSVLRIGPATFAMAPGEPFPSIGMKLKKAMPADQTHFVVGLANDELAYMMLPEEWEDDHYNYERSMSCGPQTGRLVLDSLLALLTGRP